MSDELMRRIRLGEDSAFELKSVTTEGRRVLAPDRRALADELAAFANSVGGTLILGVDDVTRDIRGIPLRDLDMVEGWVREICTDLLKPALDAVILKLELEDCTAKRVPVLRIDVPRSLFVHRSPGGYFRRIGSSKRELPPDALARLFQERSQSRLIRFDESLVPGTGRDDLDYALTRRYLRGDGAVDTGLPPDGAGDTDDDMLRKLRIVVDDPEGKIGLTLRTRAVLPDGESRRGLRGFVLQASRCDHRSGLALSAR